MKFLKRSLAVLLALAMCAGMLSLNAFAADCTHTSREYRVVEPTCEAGGYTDAYCTDCGKLLGTQQDSTPAKGHTYVDGVCSGCGTKEPCTHEAGVYVSKVLATCTEDGYRDEICKTCGEIIKHEVLKSSGHWYSNGKCTECGATCDHSCGHRPETGGCCDCAMDIGHTYGADGKCACGAEDPDKQAECKHPMTQRSYVSNSNGVWSSGSTHKVICGACSKELETRNCSGTVPVVNADGDCTTQDTATHMCGECGATATENNGIAYTEHDWKLTSTTATHTQAGVETYECSRYGCDGRKTANVEAYGHKYDPETGKCECGAGDPDHEHEYDPDTGKCACGAENPNWKPDAHPGERHTVGSSWTRDSDTHYHSCTRSGCNYREDEAAHSWNNGQCTVCHAFCSHRYINGICDRCGMSCYHSPLYRTVVEQTEATCTSNGVIAHIVCGACGATLSAETGGPLADTVIPAKGHTPALAIRENVVEATATADGSHDDVVYCDVCGDELSRETVTDPATGTGTTDPDPQPGPGGKDPGTGTGTGAGTGTTDPQPGIEIADPDVPLGGEPDNAEIEIEDVEVPLAGLMTRAEFVNYLYIQAGNPDAELSAFDDVAEDHEYAVAIGWAEASGIALGVGGNKFAPDDLVTVEQARLFLERWARWQIIEMPELATLDGKDPDDILDNANEVLDEFFGEE